MKKLYIKSYDVNGTYIKTFFDFAVGSFSKKINVGISSMSLTLARKFDDFNENGDVTLGNKLELWLTDEDTGSVPEKIYTGYIEQQNPRIRNDEEYVEILCLSVASYLTQDVLKDGAQTTLFTDTTAGITTVSATAAEIANVLKAIIDLFRENNTSLKLNYSTESGDSIETTGNDMNYTFKAMQYAEAIKKCKEIAPQNWYWYIDENEVFWFKPVPSSATHTFTIGKNISRLDVNKGLDSVKNIALVSDGQTFYSQYKDDTSIALYGRRVRQITDSALGDQTSIDNVGNSFVAENKDPKIRIVMEIIDNNENAVGYDIESIQPGETCKIVGINPSEELFTDNMIIQEVEWYDRYARIIIETRQDFDFDVFLLKLRKDVDQQVVADIPTTYS